MFSSPSKKHRPLRRRWRAVRRWLMLHVGVYLIYSLIRVWALTLRTRWVGREHIDALGVGPFIIAFSHTDMVGFAMGVWPAGKARIRNTTMMSSPSHEGRLNGRLMELIGGQIVYGSSAKRGAGALLGLQDALERGRIVGMAVDGPRGPAGVAKPGAAHLSKSTGAPVLVMRFMGSRPKRLGDWARTEIPLPFTRLTVRMAPSRVIDDIDEGTAWITETLAALRAESP